MNLSNFVTVKNFETNILNERFVCCISVAVVHICTKARNYAAKLRSSSSAVQYILVGLRLS